MRSLQTARAAAAADGPISWLPGGVSGVVRQLYAGGKITACCLVVFIFFSKA